VPTPRTGTPRYRQVAEELRRRIEAGAISAGSLLPAESALVREFGVSRGTAREAIAALRSEGLVVTEHGRGTYVRAVFEVRRLGPERHRPGNVDLATLGHQSHTESEEVAATPVLAEMFNVAPGTRLMQHRTIHRTHGTPEHLATTYYLLDTPGDVATVDPSGPRLADADRAQLHGSGITPTNIREVVRARMPTADEMNVLRLDAGVPVLTITRRTYTGERVVEVTQDLVLPANRTELEYEIHLD
jgi:GntR family transcriptional regulator